MKRYLYPDFLGRSARNPQLLMWKKSRRFCWFVVWCLFSIPPSPSEIETRYHICCRMEGWNEDLLRSKSANNEVLYFFTINETHKNKNLPILNQAYRVLGWITFCQTGGGAYVHINHRQLKKRRMHPPKKWESEPSANNSRDKKKPKKECLKVKLFPSEGAAQPNHPQFHTLDNSSIQVTNERIDVWLIPLLPEFFLIHSLFRIFFRNFWLSEWKPRFYYNFLQREISPTFNFTLSFFSPPI